MTAGNSGSLQQSVSRTVGHLAARWARADRRILRPVFPLLAAGRPVPVERICAATGSARSAVEAALEAGRAGRDTEGRVVELSGLMLEPTMHRVVIDDVALFSCCALLAGLVPLLVERSVTVESIDPVSRRVVRLVIDPEGVADVSPTGAVAGFVRTEADRMLDDVSASFCRHVHHFASRESADAFARSDPRRFVLGIEDLHRASRMLYRAAWSESRD